MDDEQETLHEPAGLEQPGAEGLITARTKRRQEQLDRLSADPSPSAPGPTRGGEIDDRNDEAYKEQWRLEHPGQPRPGSRTDRD